MKALTIGGAMVDTIAIIDSSLIERMSMSNAERSFLLLEQGKKTEALLVSTHCGGGAVNSAVALRRLGLDVATLIKVGRDDRADFVLRTLEREGISPAWVLPTELAPTGASVVLSSHDRNAAIFPFRGANTLLTPDDLDPEMFDVDVVCVSTLSDGSARCLPAIIAHVSKAATQPFVTVNPGVRQIANDFEMLHKLLPAIDLLAVNRTEAQALVRQAVAELAGSENRTLRRLAAQRLNAAAMAQDDADESAVALLGGLHALGCRRAVMTDGGRGAYALSHDKVLFCAAVEAVVMGTAGAGDAFVSTMSAYLSADRPIEDGLRAGSLNAASVVGAADAQSGLLTRVELERRIKAAGKPPGLAYWSLGNNAATR